MNSLRCSFFVRSRLRAVRITGISRRSLSSSQEDAHQYRGFLKEFTDGFKTSVKNQYEKSKELYEGIGLLSDNRDSFTNSAVAKKLRHAAEVSSSTKAKIIERVTDAADNVIESEAVQNIEAAVGSAKKKLGEISHKVYSPIADTKTAMAIGTGLKYIKDEVLETPNTNRHYEGLDEKSKREDEWENLVRSKYARSQLEKASKDTITRSDSRDIVLKPSRGINRYFDSLDTSKFFQRSIKYTFNTMMNSYGRLRNVSSNILKKFSMEEGEEAKAIKVIRQVDKEFEINAFLSQSNNYIIPAIVEAFLEKNLLILSLWSDVALYARLRYMFDPKTGASDHTRNGRLIDLRDVSVHSIALIDGKLPIITLTFNTNEVYTTTKVVRNRNKIQTDVEPAFYVVKFTKAMLLYPEVQLNMKTDGWIMLDLNRTSR